MAANTYGRQVVLPLTNKSGGGVIAGDVVILDSTNDAAFTTNTTSAFTGTVGIAQETIASNAVGRVLLAGYAALVNVNASVTRGNYGLTHTVAKQATDGGASRVVGAFCVFLTGGTTPTAHVFVIPDGSSAVGNVATDAIWDAKGDLAVGTGSNTAAKLTVGADGKVPVADAAQSSGIKWVQPYGQTHDYPRVFNGTDMFDGSSTTPFVDVSAFDTKEVLNSRILHLRTLGASHDHRVRVTPSTARAAAFDIRTSVAFFGGRWTADENVYFEIRLSTSSDVQLAVASIYSRLTAESAFMHTLKWKIGTGSPPGGGANFDPEVRVGDAVTLRFLRDGSDNLSISFGFGLPALALSPVLNGSAIPDTAVVSGTLARVEYSIHTPAGPGGTAAFDAYVDYLLNL